MFREMRRNKQVMSSEKALDVLKNATSGVLAVSGDDDYPYAVPLSFVYNDGKIYFHSAREGHKVDAIRNNDKASFCVISKDEIVPEEFTTYFRSVIAFGKIKIISDEAEIMETLNMLALKYSRPDDVAGRKRVIESSLSNVLMMELDIEHLSGKEAIELVKNKENK